MHALARDVLAALAGFLAATLWAALCTRATASTPGGARKLLHTTSGPLFFLTLPLYSSKPTAALSALVPLLFSLRLRRASSSGSSDPLAGAVARGGLRADAGGGPAAYALAVAGLALCARQHAAHVGLAALAMGDGAAGVIGRAAPLVAWPLPAGWKRKSVGGSVAFAAAGGAGAVALLAYGRAAGVLSGAAPSAAHVAAAVAAAAVVELLPGEDNFAVPVAAAGMTWALGGAAGVWRYNTGAESWVQT